jgi:hypothetical protein
MYLFDPDRGYSYGYGFVIGPNSINWNAEPIQFDTWEVRGFDIKIASNDGDNGEFGKMSNPNFNGRSISVQIMASTGFPATNDQIEQARWLKAIANTKYGETLTGIPHWVSDATSCPGPYITTKMSRINAPVVLQPPPPPLPPGDDDVNWNPSATTVASIGQAPPVVDTLAGKFNDWAVIALIKTIQKSAGLTVTGKYNQETGNYINSVI